MEVVAATPNSGGVPPFHDHDVREWSRIDSLTGVLERARLETDHWSTNTNNSCHKYGKVVDSRARSNADGALQQQARRQLEVFQSQIPGGHLQVIKTHTVSSSRWTNKNLHTNNSDNTTIKDFENLQLALNPLDLSSQKSKASVGRSVSRRPPSRQRTRNEPSSNNTTNPNNPLRDVHLTAATNLHRVSRLCHQIHETAVKQAFNKSPRQNGDGQQIEIYENSDTKKLNGHSNLLRTKSTSSEDIHLLNPEKDSTTKSIEDLEDLEQLQNWRRTSKLRRSLQFPKQQQQKTKPVDLPENSVSVRKIREELEKGRRLNTALRGNTVDLQALDQILQSISSSSSILSDKEDSENEQIKPKQKRNSFVTVESLQEVRGRLRRTSSPSLYSNNKDEEIDDGIVTEEMPEKSQNQSTRVRSYVFGMESMLNNTNNKKLGTNSLESRSSKLVNGNSSNRNEDWYIRRKSYGFEQVHNTEETSIKDKNLVESSTDSGICRSSEIVVVPTPKYENETTKTNGFGNVKKMATIFNQDRSPFKDTLKSPIKSTITIPIAKNNNNIIDLPWNEESPEKRHSIAVDESKYVSDENKFRRTSFEEENHRRTKKVEFCKTEVHFAADSGKVNIVETDEKPPPTNNFRRRRRNSGPILNDFNKNGLPMLHFGDTSYEKTMFGTDELEETVLEPEKENDVPAPFGLVTVNTNHNLLDYHEEEEEKKALQEIENIKGILKNKPMKPKPYHLGDASVLSSNSDDDVNKWGVRLRHVPIWKSTVTVHSVFDKQLLNADNNIDDDQQPEFQKLLRNLRPTTKKTDFLSDSEHRYSDSFSNIRVMSANTVKDNRRSSWSVADKYLDDNSQNVENKGYSTKVNFGDGQATVIENDPFKEKDRHPTWPRTENLTKDSKQLLNKGLVVRIGREDSASNHTVCSKMTTTQDINNTTTTTKITIDLSPSPPTTKYDNAPSFPHHTKYERSQNHSFKSTSLILNTIKDNNSNNINNFNNNNNRCDIKKDLDNKVPQQLEALKKLYEDVQSDSDADKEVQFLMSKITEADLNSIENDNSSIVSGSWSKLRAYKTISETVTKKNATVITKLEKETPDVRRNQQEERTVQNKFHNTPRKHFSPIVLRKTLPTTVNRSEIKPTEKLSSPFLVGKNTNNYDQSEFKTITDTKFQTKHTDHMVLRQPKKSEMTYFGVKVSPKPVKKHTEAVKLSEKPDLLQHYNRKSPESNKKSPIYENLRNTVDKPKKLINKNNSRDFDSSILDELTKAADQILQAVNGYTDDDNNQNKFSTTDDEETKQKNILNKQLDTIAETKSWKQQQNIKGTSKPPNSKPKLKHTSSTSSVESFTKFVKQPQPKKKISTTSDSSTGVKSTTKARRLQRASSREALLQSHGSSSEDLSIAVEAPVRKPRLVKKTKAAQLTITNGIEINKKPTPVRKKKDEISSVSKTEERVLNCLPEIRHKTAVSTIRSTAEQKSRERTKHKTDEVRVKKIQAHKKEVSSRGTNSSRTTDKTRSTTMNKETVTHRISTANIKKCHRSETGAATKH